MDKCLSIPFIFDGEDFRVVFCPYDIVKKIWIEKKNTGFFSKIFPWSKVSNTKWYSAVCLEFDGYCSNHPELNLPTHKEPNYMEEVMRFYYREWVADLISSREAHDREEGQYNYILNKNYKPDEVKYE